MNISLVPVGYLLASLAAVQQHLMTSEQYSEGRALVDDIAEFVLSGRMQLWMVHDDKGAHGHLITEIKQYPRAKYLTIQYCAMTPGTMETVEEDMQEYAERFARENGCTGIEFIGRPGWRKTAEKYGYTLQSVTYQKVFEVQS